MRAYRILQAMLAGTALTAAGTGLRAQTASGLNAAPDAPAAAAEAARPAGRSDARTSAPADASPRAASTESAAEIIVTGTQLRGVAPVGSSIISVGQQSIQDSGLRTSSEILRSIPQISGLGPGEGTTGTNVNNATLNTTKANGINLRGLGVQATLTLVDGRRQPAGGTGGQLFDASVIPAIALSRIDVVADGASATYGSDAVAGVVNLILRKDYQGVEMEARHGFASNYHDNQVAALVGRRWDGGSAMIAGEYYQHTRLRAEDRQNLFTCNLVPYGGVNACSTQAAPGNVASPTGVSFGLPGGTGVGVTAASLSTTLNTQNSALGADSLPYLRRKSVVANANQRITDKLTVYAEGYFSYRNFNSRAGGAVIGSSTPVPSTNPFFVRFTPTQTSEVVSYNLLNDLGAIVRGGFEKTYQLAGGLDYDINGNFRLSLSGAHSSNRTDEKASNTPNTALVSAALALTDPATAFNPFGSGGNNNPATLDSFRGFTDRQAYFDTDLFDAKVDGALFHIGGGDVRVAVGGEYHHDAFRSVDQGNNMTTALNLVRTNADTTRRRNVASAFGELNVPLVGADNAFAGVQRLEVNAAVRYDHYSDVGSSTNPKVGLRYDPVAGLSLHASYGTSFRAPTLSDLNPASTATVFSIANFLSYGNIVEYVGGNSNLKPETAKTYSIGLDFKPKPVPGLTLSANYYRISYANVIDSLPIRSSIVFIDPGYAPYVTYNPTVAQVNAVFSPFYAPAQTLPASSIRAIVDARRNNLGGVHTDGLDFTVNYVRPTDIGTFSIGGNGTYLLNYKVALAPGQTLVQRVNQANYPLRFRGRGNFGWSNDTLRLNGFVNYTNPYDNRTGTITALQRVKSYVTVDGTLTFNLGGTGWLGAWGQGVQLTVSAQNLFDRKPPFAAIAATQVFDSTVANPLGRLVSVSARAKF